MIDEAAMAKRWYPRARRMAYRGPLAHCGMDPADLVQEAMLAAVVAKLRPAYRRAVAGAMAEHDQSQTASDLGVTQSRVSQLLAAAVLELRRKLWAWQ